MAQDEPNYDARIKKLEEDFTFLEQHVSQQDKEMLNIQQKLEKTISEIKEMRNYFNSDAFSTGSSEQKPPHY